MGTSQRSLLGAWSRSLYTGAFHGQMFTRAGMPSQGNLHCARRCRALGEQLGAMRSRCDCAALGAAAGQACSRGGHDLVVASTPQALDGRSSRHQRTLRARAGSPATKQDLGHVGLEQRAAAGTCGPSPNPAAGPKRLRTRPARLHKDLAKKF